MLTPHNVTTRLGRAIRILRVARGMTQSDLAEKLRVSVATISHWESGQRDLGARRLPKLANALTCSPATLAGLSVGFRAMTPALRELALREIMKDDL